MKHALLCAALASDAADGDCDATYQDVVLPFVDASADRVSLALDAHAKQIADIRKKRKTTNQVRYFFPSLSVPFYAICLAYRSTAHPLVIYPVSYHPRPP